MTELDLRHWLGCAADTVEAWAAEFGPFAAHPAHQGATLSGHRLAEIAAGRTFR